MQERGTNYQMSNNLVSANNKLLIVGSSNIFSSAQKVLFLFYFSTCRQVAGPNLPKIDDCLSETDPCNVSASF
jgi:hypothetical protein